jgi:hypothetical protein
LDEQLVRDTFWGEEAEVILTIPIGEGLPDRPAWHFDSKGLFSVKSVYKLAAQNHDNEAGQEAGTSTEGGSAASPFPWHKIWQLKVPSKVQMFFWRFVHNSLPLRRNLKRRKIKTETLCPMCNRLDEDCDHLFFKCKGAQECWRAMNMEDLRCTLANCGSGMEVAMKI